MRGISMALIDPKRTFRPKKDPLTGKKVTRTCQQKGYNPETGTFFRCNSRQQCDACFLSWLRIWEMRLGAHAYTSDHCLFVTLTFDDEHLHLAGRTEGNRHTTFRQYMQNIRRYYGGTVEYVASYELGEKTGRAHYHAILLFGHGDREFDLPLDVRTNLPHWSHGMSQYELPRTKTGALQYTIGYVAKGQGGEVLRPSNGIGKRYLVNFARYQAENKRPLWRRWKGRESIKVRIPGMTIKKKGITADHLTTSNRLREYEMPMSHPYAVEMVEAYREAFEERWGELAPFPLKINIDETGIEDPQDRPDAATNPLLIAAAPPPLVLPDDAEWDPEWDDFA